MKNRFFLNTLLSLLITSFITLSGSAAKGENPEKLTKLKKSYHTEIERVTTPVNEKYIKALERLQKSYAAANKLDEAILVREKIALFKSPPSAPAIKKTPTLKQDDPSAILRRWAGDGKLTVIDGEEVLHVTTDLTISRKMEYRFNVKNYPRGFRLHVYYRSNDYVGTGLKLKSYYTSRDYIFRAVTLITDGKWHEYVWNYDTDKYRTAADVRLQIEILGGTGEIDFKELSISHL